MSKPARPAPSNRPQDLRQAVRQSASAAPIAAPARMVNRTHRVVRERAMQIEAHRRQTRSLWLPLAVCSALLLVVCGAVWTMLAEDDLAPTGLPDASQQIFVLALWCLPLTAALLAFVWFHLDGGRLDGGNRDGSMGSEGGGAP